MTEFPDWVERLDLPELLKPGEFAALLRVDAKTVTRWGASGKVPCIYTPGGHRRFPRKVVKEVLARQVEGRRDR